MKEHQSLRNLDNTPPNVVIFTWWHQAVMLAMVMVLPVGVTGIFIVVGIYINLPAVILVLGALILAITSLWLAATQAGKIFPKDVMCIENNAVIGKRHGVIPFDSITEYNLDDNRIKIHRKGRATLRLMATQERRSYAEFHAAFVSAILTWKSLHPDSNMKQAYFYGSWKAKAVGGVLLLGSVGSIIAAIAFDVFGVLGGAFIGASMGLYLIFSKRKINA